MHVCMCTWSDFEWTVGRYLSTRRQRAEQIKSINVRGNLLVTGREREREEMHIDFLKIIGYFQGVFRYMNKNREGSKSLILR